MVAENLHAQCDSDGDMVKLIDEIVDHKSDNTATKVSDGKYFDNRTQTWKTRKNLKGWELLVRWKDENVEWVPLRYMYDLEPLMTAEYAVMNKLVEQPAFKWWVEDALNARQLQISAVKSNYWSRTEKFGLPLPKSVREAINIDNEHYDPHNPRGPKPMLWSKAIEKEMNAVLFWLLGRVISLVTPRRIG